MSFVLLLLLSFPILLLEKISQDPSVNKEKLIHRALQNGRCEFFDDVITNPLFNYFFRGTCKVRQERYHLEAYGDGDLAFKHKPCSVSIYDSEGRDLLWAPISCENALNDLCQAYYFPGNPYSRVTDNFIVHKVHEPFYGLQHDYETKSTRYKHVSPRSAMNILKAAIRRTNKLRKDSLGNGRL